MFYVSFWANGIEKTIADKFDRKDWAKEYAREVLSSNKSYDEAVIWAENEEEETEFYEAVTR